MAVARIWLLHAPTGTVETDDREQILFGLDPSFALAAPEGEAFLKPKGTLYDRAREFHPASHRSVPRGGRWYR